MYTQFYRIVDYCVRTSIKRHSGPYTAHASPASIVDSTFCVHMGLSHAHYERCRPAVERRRTPRATPRRTPRAMGVVADVPTGPVIDRAPSIGTCGASRARCDDAIERGMDRARVD